MSPGKANQLFPAQNPENRHTQPINCCCTGNRAHCGQTALHLRQLQHTLTAQSRRTADRRRCQRPHQHVSRKDPDAGAAFQKEEAADHHEPVSYTHLPPSRATEYFGFYDIFGKFAAVLGPVFVAVFSSLTGHDSIGVLSLVVLFAVGFVILFAGRKKMEASQLAARSETQED